MERDVVDVRADGRERTRRGYSEAYKRRLVALTQAPRASVSRIAQRHGVNANLLFTWRRRFGASNAAAAVRTVPAGRMLPVMVELSGQEGIAEEEIIVGRRSSEGCVEIEIGAGRVRLHGTVQMQVLEALIRMLERTR